MDPRISLITLAVADVAATRAFYVDGLGWETVHDDGDVLMISVGERLLLSLWHRPSFEAEVGELSTGPGLAPITLAHNVASPADVDRVLATARSAGADPESAGEQRAWGGYTGYFADPDGYRWEVAYNPGAIGDLVAP